MKNYAYDFVTFKISRKYCIGKPQKPTRVSLAE